MKTYNLDFTRLNPLNQVYVFNDKRILWEQRLKSERLNPLNQVYVFNDNIVRKNEQKAQQVLIP